MPTEKNGWKWLSKARDQMDLPVHIERVENIAGAGHPDVELCYMGVQNWIEQKAAHRPARPSTKLRFGSPLRDSQVEWAKKRIAAGGRVWYLIQVGAGHERQMYLVRATIETIDALFNHVTEDWCRAHDSLDDATPRGVVQTVTFAD